MLHLEICKIQIYVYKTYKVYVEMQSLTLTLQAYCQNLLSKNFLNLLEACCKLFQQVVTSLQITRRDILKLDDIEKFVATC